MVKEAAELVTVELKFVKTTPRYLVALDETGKDRWFNMSRVGYAIDGDVVSITLNSKEWDRRQRPEGGDIEAEDTSEHVTRKCLCCRKTVRLPKEYRICYDCKKTSEWKYAGYMCS